MSMYYKNNRPSLCIMRTGGAKLGNCYNASYFEVTSTQPLTNDDLNALRDMGFLGYGQAFYIKGPLKSPTEQKPKPSGTDVVSCIDTKTGKVAINPYSNFPYPDKELPYYTYCCESRVDSSG